MRRLMITVLLLMQSSGCAIYHHYGPYYGKVVDAETKQPLEGAAVLAVYFTKLYTPGGPVGYYLDAQETVTDKNGEFSIPVNNSFAFRPFSLFDPNVRFTIFKPGYGYYPGHPHAKPKFTPNWSLPSSSAVIVELPKLFKGEMSSEPYINPHVPFEKKKQFIRIINIDRKQAGVELLPDK